jgi:hypothetical protein
MLWDFSFQSLPENGMRRVVEGLVKQGRATDEGKRAQRWPNLRCAARV